MLDILCPRVGSKLKISGLNYAEDTYREQNIVLYNLVYKKPQIWNCEKDRNSSHERKTNSKNTCRHQKDRKCWRRDEVKQNIGYYGDFGRFEFSLITK